MVALSCLEYRRDLWYDQHGGIPHREGDGDEFPSLRPRPPAHLILTLNAVLSNQLVKFRRKVLLSVPVPLPVGLCPSPARLAPAVLYVPSLSGRCRESAGPSDGKARGRDWPSLFAGAGWWSGSS